MLDEFLELFGRKKAKGRGYPEGRDLRPQELDDDADGRRRNDDDDDDANTDDPRDSHERPSKKRRFGDLLDMD